MASSYELFRITRLQVVVRDRRHRVWIAAFEAGDLLGMRELQFLDQLRHCHLVASIVDHLAVDVSPLRASSATSPSTDASAQQGVGVGAHVRRKVSAAS